jgi:hypothetical protein
MSTRPASALGILAFIGLLIGPIDLTAQASAGGVEIHSLSINTRDFEYAPTITADGRTLYYCSDRPDGVGGHDIWVATRAGDGAWDFSAATNIGEPVNTPLNEGVASIAADGRTIFFTGCQRDDGLGDCDIYIAELVGGSFTNIRNLRTINSPYWDTQPTVSADGRTLCFVSNRPGALGGTADIDLYVSTKLPNGEWSAPRNLGEPVNTRYREDSPYLHPSGELLYFSSAGHGGLGGLDFNVSRREGDGWSAPSNLGAPINTSRDERFITVPASGTEVYFSSERTDVGNLGKLDIFVATGVTIPSGIGGTIAASGTLSATPNPARDRIDVMLTGLDAAPGVSHELSISDARGAVVARHALSGERTSVDISGLSSGLYLLRVGGLATTVMVRK